LTIGTIELSLFDHVLRLNAGDEFGGIMKFFESQHGSWSALDSSVVLFHKIVQIFRLARRDFPIAVDDQAVRCLGISAALVDDNFSGTSCNPIARSKKLRAAA